MQWLTIFFNDHNMGYCGPEGQQMNPFWKSSPTNCPLHLASNIFFVCVCVYTCVSAHRCIHVTCCSNMVCLLMSCSVRTPISMKFFPRFFLLYFLVFHIYFFSYAYGMALSLFGLISVSGGKSNFSHKLLVG